MAKQITIAALETSLVGRKVRFNPEGKGHMRSDLPHPTQECSIVAAWIADGQLQLAIEDPDGQLIELPAKFCDPRCMFALVP